MVLFVKCFDTIFSIYIIFSLLKLNFLSLEKYGSVIKITILNQTFVHTVDPDEIKVLLSCAYFLYLIKIANF